MANDFTEHGVRTSFYDPDPEKRLTELKRNMISKTITAEEIIRSLIDKDDRVRNEANNAIIDNKDLKYTVIKTVGKSSNKEYLRKFAKIFIDLPFDFEASLLLLQGGYLLIAGGILRKLANKGYLTISHICQVCSKAELNEVLGAIKIAPNTAEITEKIYESIDLSRFSKEIGNSNNPVKKKLILKRIKISMLNRKYGRSNTDFIAKMIEDPDREIRRLAYRRLLIENPNEELIRQYLEAEKITTTDIAKVIINNRTELTQDFYQVIAKINFDAYEDKSYNPTMIKIGEMKHYNTDKTPVGVIAYIGSISNVRSFMVSDTIQYNDYKSILFDCAVKYVSAICGNNIHTANIQKNIMTESIFSFDKNINKVEFVNRHIKFAKLILDEKGTISIFFSVDRIISDVKNFI